MIRHITLLLSGMLLSCTVFAINPYLYGDSLSQIAGVKPEAGNAP